MVKNLMEREFYKNPTVDIKAHLLMDKNMEMELINIKMD
jgi:hypothetical protein